MEIPSDEELLKKTQAELETLKLALEISAFDEDRKTERRKSRGETYRTIIIAFLAAFLSLGTTFLLKVYDHNNLEVDSANTQIANFKQQYYGTQNTATRLSIACEIGQVRVPKGNKEIADTVARYQALCAGSKVIAKTDTTSSRLINTVHANYISTAQKKKLESLDIAEKKYFDLKAKASSKDAQVKNDAQTQLTMLTKDVAAALPTDLKTAVQSSNTISTNAIKQINSVLGNAGSQTKFDTIYPIQYFKPGYFVLFDNIRVGLISLDRGSGTITVNICVAQENTDCGEKIRTGNVSFDLPLDFFSNGKSYRLYLKKIDHGGLNPFTYAAYINLAVLSQQSNP
jgi:hypothetical protein